MEIQVQFENAKSLNNFISVLTSNDCKVVSFENTGDGANLILILPTNNFHEEVMRIFKGCKGMVSIEEL